MCKKKTVHCRLSSLPVLIGKYAFIFPIDHPGDEVSNASLALTSEVIAIFRDPEIKEIIGFETLNTSYKVVTKEEKK